MCNEVEDNHDNKGKATVYPDKTIKISNMYFGNLTVYMWYIVTFLCFKVPYENVSHSQHANRTHEILLSILEMAF